MSEEEESRCHSGSHSGRDYGPDDSELDELVYFNVSGKSFATTIHTLEVFPKSLLGCKEERDLLPRTKCGEIFLNRNAGVFDSVLTFYQTGILEAPLNVNQNIFVKDVTYYGLQDEAVASGLKEFDCLAVPFPKNNVQACEWIFMGCLNCSNLARFLPMCSLAIIIISIVVFCWETYPDYKKPLYEMSASKQLIVKSLKGIEVFCIIYFTLEIIIRFCCAPVKKKFVKDWLNVIDFVSILPFYITLIFKMDGNFSIYFVRVVRLVRVFRVFKLSRHSSLMRIFGMSIKDSVRELGVLLFFIVLGVLLFSSAVYYAEDGAKGSKLQSIPGAFWWSIVTMTTVGYGDEFPTSIGGKLIGAVCAMTGILVIALPIPTIVNNFTRQYQKLKPVSRYWLEFQSKEKEEASRRLVLGLCKLCDLSENDLLTLPRPYCGDILVRRSIDEPSSDEENEEYENSEEVADVRVENTTMPGCNQLETNL